MSCHVMPLHVMSCHVMSHHAMLCYVTSHVMTCHITYYVMLYMSVDIMACHFISDHTTPYRVISHHVTSCSFMWCHIILCHIHCSPTAVCGLALLFTIHWQAIIYCDHIASTCVCCYFDKSRPCINYNIRINTKLN